MRAAAALQSRRAPACFAELPPALVLHCRLPAALAQEGLAAAQREARQLQAENEELRQAALASRSSLEVGASAAASSINARFG